MKISSMLDVYLSSHLLLGKLRHTEAWLERKQGWEKVSHTGLAPGGGVFWVRSPWRCAVVSTDNPAGAHPGTGCRLPSAQAGARQGRGRGGTGAELPSSGASDKGLQGLGAPGRCDKAAGRRGGSWGAAT